jgi:hypothetical protein
MDDGWAEGGSTMTAMNSEKAGGDSIYNSKSSSEPKEAAVPSEWTADGQAEGVGGVVEGRPGADKSSGNKDI